MFRPLRFVNKFEGMKEIVSTLALSASSLADTLQLCILLIFIFGIVGVTLFGGVLRHQCYMSSTDVSSNTTGWLQDTNLTQMCGGGFICPADRKCVFAHANPHYNFLSMDNIGAATLVLIQSMTMEGWTDVMYAMQVLIDS